MKQLLAILTIILMELSLNAQEVYKGLTADEWIEKANKTLKNKKKECYLKNAAMTGSAKGQFEYAHYLQLHSQQQQSLQYYMLSAQQDYAPAQCKMGHIFDYEDGYGVVHNVDSALFWYLKAVKQQYENAYIRIGFMYYENKEYTNAVLWFDKIITSNETSASLKCHAYFALGKIYEEGSNEIPRDYIKAFQYYSSADVDENKTCRESTQKAIIRLKPIIIAEYKIPEMEKKYGNTNNSEKLVELANLYTSIKKYDKSYGYMLKAARLGNVNAQYETGFMYYYGVGTTKDFTKAVYWYKKAAAKNHGGAINLLANCYFEGQGVAKDLKLAFSNYKKAATLNNPEGCYNLGLCYESGTGVTKNMDEALKWYKKASDLGNEDGANRYAELTKPKPEQTTTSTTASTSPKTTTSSSSRGGGGFWDTFADVLSKTVDIMENVANLYENNNSTSTQNSSGYYSYDDNNNNGYASSGYSSASSQGGYKAKVMCRHCFGTGKAVVYNTSKCNNKNCLSHFCTICYKKHCTAHNLKHEECTWCHGNGYRVETVYQKPYSKGCNACHNVGFAADFSCHGGKDNCAYTQCPLCGKKHCLQHDHHTYCGGCKGIFALDTYADNDFAAKSDYVSPTKIDCKYCNGTGKCQKCANCYFIDQNGKKVGAYY